MIGALLGLFGGGSKSVSVSPAAVFGGVTGPGTATSDYVTVNQINLVAPITYAWSRVSGNISITPSFSNGQITNFYGYVNGAQISAVWKCTVTDGTGFSQDTNDVTITFEDYRV